MSRPRQSKRHPAAVFEGAAEAAELLAAGTCKVEGGRELVEATATRDVVASLVEAARGAEVGTVVVAGASDVSIAIPAPLHSETWKPSEESEFKETSAAIWRSSSVDVKMSSALVVSGARKLIFVDC